MIEKPSQINQPIIAVKNLEKTFYDETQTTALNGVTFNIKEGEFVAIMGPSGSGKSTLLHILGFLDHATGGEYLFEGKAQSELKDEELAHVRNKKMGFTLIEILIALFVFTIISMIMVSALHNIFNYQAETEKQAARLNELQLALLFGFNVAEINH